MKTAILFDLDGTLLDTLTDIAAAVNHVLEEMGYPRRTREEVLRFVGNGARYLMYQAIPEGGDLDTALKKFQTYYSANCQIATKPYDGIPKALEILAKKYLLAIVSNKPDTAVKPLCSGYVPGIYARGENADCPRKPAPDMVYKTMAEIGAESCIYVGDSEVDVLTAKNAGVPCLSVLWGFRNREDMEAVGGCHFCERTEELVEKIEELTHGQ